MGRPDRSPFQARMMVDSLGSSSGDGDKWLYSVMVTRGGASSGRREIRSIKHDGITKSYMETKPH